MPEPVVQQTDAAASTIQPQGKVEAVQPDLGIDPVAAHAAAEQILQSLHQTQNADKPRDEYGRFAATSAKPADSASTTDGGLDPSWKEIAKENGISDEDFSTFKSVDDLQARVVANQQANQVRYLQALQIDPRDYQAYLELRAKQQNGQAPVQTTAQPPQQGNFSPQTTQTAVEPLKLNINEEDFAPEVVNTFKSMAEVINKQQAQLAEVAGLKQELQTFKEQQRQSAIAMQQAREQAEIEATSAKVWDSTAAEIPGFMDHFGKPSEFKARATMSPTSSKVADAAAFNQYLQVELNRMANIQGDPEKLFKIAFHEAWKKSPFSRVAGNGTQNGQQRNGSVMVPTRRVGSTPPVVSDKDANDIHEEMRRISDVVGEMWDHNGNQNPFRNLAPLV